jgi:hypothetical protein
VVVDVKERHLVVLFAKDHQNLGNYKVSWRARVHSLPAITYSVKKFDNFGVIEDPKNLGKLGEGKGGEQDQARHSKVFQSSRMLKECYRTSTVFGE